MTLVSLTTEEAQRIFDQITHLPDATAPRKEILSYKVEKTFKQGKPNLVLTIDGHSPTYIYLRQIASTLEELKPTSANTFAGSKLVFPRSKSQNTFVAAYYLYQFLIGNAKLGDDLMVDDIAACLDITAFELRKITKALRVFCRVIQVDPSAHFTSVKESLLAQKYGERVQIENYTYKFDQLLISAAGCTSPSRLPLKLSFSLTKPIWDILYRLGYTLPDQTKLSSFLTYIQSQIKAKYQNNNRLTVKNNCIYVCSYSLLDVEAGDYTIGEVRKACDIRKIVSFIEGKDNDVRFSSGRLYHSFHNLPRWARKNLIRYKGSPLVEAMDVHNAFFVFLAKIFRTVPSIDRTELAKYKDVVCRGVLYEEVMQFTGNVDRNAVKEQLNAYKNAKMEQMRVMAEHEYFRTNFPSITRYLTHYPTYEKAGEKVKYIQIDASYVETVLVSRVCAALAAHGATPFSLHDAVYVSEEDKAMLDAKGVNVEAIFWDAYRNLTDSEVKSLIDTSRAQK